MDSDKSREELVAELEAARQRVAELEADSGRNRAEERLRSLSHMVEQSSDAIVQTDENFNIVYVNKAAEELFGWRFEEIEGKTPEIFNAEPVPSEYQDAIYRKISAGEPFLGEALNKRKDGSTFRCQINISPIFDGQGRISGYMGLQRDITEHKRAEEALRESEERFRRVTENAKYMVYRMSLPDGVYEYVSPPSLDIFGYTPEEFLESSMLIREVIHPDWREYFAEQWARLLQGDMAPTYEYQIIHKSGEIRWLYQRNTLVLDEAGIPVAIEGVVSDITARKRTEERLRESEAFIKAVMENLPIGIAVNSVDPTVQFEYMNENFLRFYRTNREALKKQDAFWGAVYEDSEFREEIKTRVLEDCASGDPERMYWVDVPITRKGEETRFITARNTPVPAKGLTISTVWDVTERKQAEEELRESERRLWKVVAKSPYPMCIVDQSGDVQFYNQKSIETYGYTLEAVRTAEQWWMNAYPDPDYRERVKASWEAAAAAAQATGKEIEAQEWRMRCSDGTYKDVEFKLVSLGEISVIAMLDVTPFRALELELRNSKEAAEAANLAKSEFLANMSHEIRTPLNGVLGMLQVLQESPLDGGQEECLHAALNSGRSLIRIISDILDLSRIESGKMDIRKEGFEVRGIMHSIQGAFMNEVARKDLTLSYRIDPALPLVVRGDSGRLRQILFNLVGNSIKFTAQGRVDVRVYPEGMEKGTDHFALCLDVSDTGIGIPEGKLAAIFEPFTQVDGSHTREYGGTGLGLSIVKRLLDLMGGAIWLESEEGVGTTISFRVPVKSLPDKEALQETQEQPDSCAYNLKILLAEDDLSNQLVAKRMLEKQGHTVVCVESGRKVLAALDKDTFDLILMDVQMPEMDGTEATREIRKDERFRDLPIIALTAHAMAGDRERFLEAGMNDYLSKPVEIDELRQTLDRAMAGRRRG